MESDGGGREMLEDEVWKGGDSGERTVGWGRSRSMGMGRGEELIVGVQGTQGGPKW